MNNKDQNLKMEKGSLWVIFAALVCGYVFVFGLLRKFNELYYVSLRGKTKYPLPPGQMGWPLLGNLSSFLKAFKSDNPDSFVNNLVSRHGQTGMYKTFLFGNPSIIVCSPETCKKVMTDDEKFKLGYPKATVLLTGRNSFHDLSNAEHKWLRHLTMAPISGHKALGMYVEVIENTTVNYLKEWSSTDQPVELLSELRKVTFKAIVYIFMGPGKDKFIEAVMHLYTDLISGMKAPVIKIPGFAFHKALQARKQLVSILQSVLDQKKKMIRGEADANKKDMMDLMLDVKDEEESRPLEDKVIIDLLLSFLLAGHETSAHATLWAVIYLTKHPEYFRKAKEEQEGVLKRRPSSQKGLTLEDIRHMPYLSKVIDETLRITSLSFVNFREAKVDVHINGYTIPKGWKVMVWNRGVHMDPNIYQNPKEFDPERWENYRPKPGYFLPFGIGSRLCPGSDLAKMEISIFLHHILLHYKIERVNPNAPITFLPIPRPSDNCLARVIKVNP